MLRILTVDIDNIGPIETLRLRFDSSFNILCGQNGVGKTTILDCLAQTFVQTRSTLKKKAGSQNGGWKLRLSLDGNVQDRSISISAFGPQETVLKGAGFSALASQVIVFKTRRNIGYAQVDSIAKDRAKGVAEFSSEILNGSFTGDLKNWFVNRHLWSKHEGHLDPAQLRNIAMAKECFSILDEKIKFSRVDPTTNDVMLSTPAGEIYLEYLSAGYQSCIAVLIGMIKEVEYRHKEPRLYVGDFDGVVMVDELDLHLHPDWQAKIYASIKRLLPRAQIFTSTHSPHIIQIASPKEVIALVQTEDNRVAVNQLLNEEFGCQGWTVEEILKDVMGMADIRSRTFLDAVELFNQAMEEEDAQKARSAYQLLDRMLHPENTLRKLLRIQLAGLGATDDQAN